ncbi:hypothetical protein I350_02196 [Cryptococcus amylolentus CBS 6273]|uniref:GH16 domain-containing protein n=1 Tax=Cryptococcus amylolentus CBS 6273 TaxID=1296118 RepID=A0A1E3KCG1_9TREE|nr:hypothetical protein I350_02196 [Cryptococcus amylolentus CBS 6273]
MGRKNKSNRRTKIASSGSANANTSSAATLRDEPPTGRQHNNPLSTVEESPIPFRSSLTSSPTNCQLPTFSSQHFASLVEEDDQLSPTAMNPSRRSSASSLSSADPLPPHRRATASSLDDAPVVQRRVSAHSLDDDDEPVIHRRPSASSLDDPAPSSGLAVPQRPSLTSTPSEQPLLAVETPREEEDFEVPSPGAEQQLDHREDSTPNTSFFNNHHSSAPSAAPKIRINDMPNSPPVHDDSRVPTPPVIASLTASPFAHGVRRPHHLQSQPPTTTTPINPTNITHEVHTRQSFASAGSPSSYHPRNLAGVGTGMDNSSALAGPGPSTVAAATPNVPIHTAGLPKSVSTVITNAPGVSARTTGFDLPNSTSQNTIAERRAMRMKQTMSTSTSRRSRINDMGTTANKPVKGVLNRKPFQSTRLKGEIYKPWLEKKDPALRWARWITLTSIFIGFAIAGIICWDGYRSVPKLGTVCSILNEDWSNGIDSSIWQHEVRTDGYGPGSFSWTTASSNNSYVEDGILYIVPTLTSDTIGIDAVTSGYTLNLTADGTCTSSNVSQCVAVSNSSKLTVINPVQTARLITKNTVSLKYGKVEVKAKFPTGDWLWPRVMLLPVNETYGTWPRSGQIDIMSGRGNNASYAGRGVDYAQSDLHWGPTTALDRLYLTWGYREQRRTYYSDKYHTFGFEWNENYLWTYIDSRVSQVVSLRFNKESFWTRGKFPSTYTNNSDVVKLTNPWSSSENNNAPFDQKFYLAIDLAVGSTDGWFPDSEGGKPWTDDSASAMSDFWAARSKWNGTSWSSDPKTRGFAVDTVKVWEVC